MGLMVEATLEGHPGPERPKPHHSHYATNRNLKVKVLDFVKSSGPNLTIDSTIFELCVVL